MHHICRPPSGSVALHIDIIECSWQILFISAAMRYQVCFDPIHEFFEQNDGEIASSLENKILKDLSHDLNFCMHDIACSTKYLKVFQAREADGDSMII